MLVWLDNATNKAGKPNENYARELMELFTLGIGNYTQQDVTELARASAAPISPVVATLSAAAAAVLDPSFVALVAFAGARLITAPSQRARWAPAVPAAGIVAIALAVVAGTRWPALGTPWFGRAPHPVDMRALVGLVGAALGPLTAVAALAGLPSLVRARTPELAVAAAVVGAMLVDLRAGAPGPATLGLAAALSGLAIARLARMIPIPSGQAIAGATIGALVVVPPAWTAVELRATAAHTGHASR